MTIVPVLSKDLWSSQARGRLSRDRVLAGSIAGVLFVALAAVDRWSSGVNIIRFLKGVPLAGIVPYLLLVVGLSRGSKLLAVERREGTLPLLLLTRLTGNDIVLGKLVVALTVELNSLLSAVPAFVVPLLMAGFKWTEICFLVLGSANVLFCGLALGLSSAVFFDEERAAGWIVLLVLPFAVLATPFAVLLPNGPFRQTLAMLQPFNPGEALAHVQTVAGGFRAGTFWTPLLFSHLIAWGFLGATGLLLARTCRRQAGRDAGPRSKNRLLLWKRPNRSLAVRERLLNRNPFLWLASRHQWVTVQTWLYIILAILFWGWLAWLSWFLRGVNIMIVLVIAVAASWAAQFAVILPVEASRRLAEDRQSGALEMLLCTPLSVEGIIQGQWLALRRRFVPPLLLAMILSLILMLAGYLTYGFGGMLEPEDRALWLFAWLAAAALLPLSLTTLCWVSMRRTLTARHVGDASGLAILQVIGLPLVLLPLTSTLLHALFGWNLRWPWNYGLFVASFALAQVGFAWRARTLLFRNLRSAAAKT